MKPVKTATVRFTVTATGKEDFNTSNQQKAQDKVVEYQRSIIAKIVIHNHTKKNAVQYQKSPNENNYRVSKGDYREAVSREVEVKKE
jgi:hypothetical protein